MGDGYRDDGSPRLRTRKRGCLVVVVLAAALAIYGKLRFWVWMVNN
jgi:hypothetical protein